MNDIIIAKYTEDINWINKLNKNLNPIIYDKYAADSHNYLPNVGREAHTYLYHIVHNYESLNDINIFCQGNPFDHEPNFLSKISDESLIDNLNILGFYSFGPSVVEGAYANFDPRHPNGLPMFYMFDLLFGLQMKPNDNYSTNYGAQFIVTKYNIHSRPLSLYNFLLQYVSDEVNPIEAYIFERLWPYVFNPKFYLTPKICRILKHFERA